MATPASVSAVSVFRIFYALYLNVILVGFNKEWMVRKIIFWLSIAAVIVFLVFFGMWMEFNETQRSILRWMSNDQKIADGLSWIAENTGGDAVIVAWWDYGVGIEELSRRRAVISEASREIRWTIAGMRRSPWSWIEYELWYPFESEEKVKDVGRFFTAEDASEAIGIARKYGAEYVFVVYPDDIMKFYAIVMATGRQPTEYLGESKATTEEEMIKEIESRELIKKETVGIRLIYGDRVVGFEKVFDNERVRIYKIVE